MSLPTKDKKNILILINNNKQVVFENSSLEDLVFKQKISRDGVATAVNNKFVCKTERKDCILEKNDSVTIFSAITGG